MPMYEYRCTTCNHQFELLQKFSDAPARQCPKCGAAVEKMISSTAFSLKGDGWFNTGYCPKTEAAKPAACAGSGCCAS
jgi:putative FmdB family regulatory protein